MNKFVIYTDSAADIPSKIRKEHHVEYFPMSVIKEGREMIADMDWEIYSPEEFYGWMKAGIKLKTALITVETFSNQIREWFKKGIDVLYLGCSSALTGSINSFNLAKELLLEEFPDRRMEAVPTFAASATLGMMVIDASRVQENGGSMDDVIKYVEDNRFNYNQFCTVDTLSYLKEAGRIKGSKAFFGNIVGVKPIFISDRKGNNFVIEKVRGTKASLDGLFNHIKDVYIPGKTETVVILHSDVPERATILKERFINEMGVKNVIIDTLGPIVGISCGPGAIATFCYGKEVTRYEGDGIEIE